MYLMSKGLWESVVGTEESELKKQQAHAAIVLNLSDSQLMHMFSANYAREAWCTLDAFHRTTNMANRLWLKERFASFKYTKPSIGEHVRDLERLVMEMQYTNCEPSEEDTCATMLRSLPASYEGLIQAFRMTTVQFRFSDLVSKLLAEEVRQNESCRIEEATAMFEARRKERNLERSHMGGERRGFLVHVSSAVKSFTLCETVVRMKTKTNGVPTNPTSHLILWKV